MRGEEEQNEETNDQEQEQEDEPPAQEPQDEQVLVVILPRTLHHTANALKAKMKELQNFKDFKVYVLVPDRGQPRIRHNWIMTQKMLDGSVIIKARLVARGDEERELLRTDSPTTSKKTLKIIFVLAAQMGWKVESGDIRAAFLQGESLDREVNLVPPPEANNPGMLWRLLKLIYGLNDASRKFYIKLVEKIIGLGCKKSKFDYAIFYYHVNSSLQGIIGGHIDDLSYNGTPSFYQKIVEPLKNHFKFGAMSQETFKYVGWNIAHQGNTIKIDQDDYEDEKCREIKLSRERAEQIEEPVTSEEQKSLRQLIGRSRWVTDQTRPDCSYDELELSMIVNKATVKDLIKANKMMKK